MTDIQKGDKGSSIRIQVFEGNSPLNVASATNIWIHLKAPTSGTVSSFTGAIVTGASGILGYTTTTSTDISEAGTYLIQGEFSVGSWTGNTSTNELIVYDNIAKLT